MVWPIRRAFWVIKIHLHFSHYVIPTIKPKPIGFAIYATQNRHAWYHIDCFYYIPERSSSLISNKCIQMRKLGVGWNVSIAKTGRCFTSILPFTMDWVLIKLSLYTKYMSENIVSIFYTHFLLNIFAQYNIYSLYTIMQIFVG